MHSGNAVFNGINTIIQLRKHSSSDIALFDQLIEKQREGRTFVMVSHDLRKGFDMCTHALVLARGRVVTFGPKEDFDFAEFSELYRSTVGMGVA